MSKINVNPNHYKVAGRERQGEDILQERHRQKHRQNLALERFEGPRGASASPVKARRAAFAPGLAPAVAAKSTAKRSSTSRSSVNREAAAEPPVKRAPSRVRASSGTSKAKPRSSTKAAPAPKRAPRRSAGTNLQASDKRGKRSTAQKRASSRNDFESMPATRPVAGAFGREPSSRGSRNKKR